MKTILVVDQEENVLNALSELLARAEEISVLTSESSDRALEYLTAQPVDLLIADPGVSDAGGVPLTAKVEAQFPGLPRISLEQEGFGSGTKKDDPTWVPVISKPWDTDELRATVEETLALAEFEPVEADLVRLRMIGLTDLERGRRIQQKLHRDRSLPEVLIELGKLKQEHYDECIRLRRSKMDVIELLAADGYLTEEQLKQYERARSETPDIDERRLLLENNFVTEEQYLKAFSASEGLLYLEPDVGGIDRSLLKRTSMRYMMRHCFLPLWMDGPRLTVIFADIGDRLLLVELERLFGCKIKPALCATSKLEEALNIIDRLRGDKKDGNDLGLQYREIEESEGDENGEEAVQIVDYLLARAIQLGASDLHIEPMQSKIRVRTRIDGVLQHLTDLPADFAPRVVSRVKILAGADIAEKRLHQDGKIFVKIEGGEVDIRVSSYVSVYGETIVMRLLDRNKGILPLEKVGFTPNAFASLTEVVLESSSGLVLLVGPTGSGKTTTLYSFLDHANDPSEKVITAEDPVEYVIEGLIQCSVNQKTGPTFPDSLRAIVRQDPDTIVVGEVRDEITASLALESALTGHKVFSTFHTEEAVGAFVRLLEMGLESFLVASTVSAVIAQRLVRRLCMQCRKPGEPTRAELRFLGIDRSELRGVRFWAPGGCSECNDSGYKGRLAIHEVLLPDDDLRDAVLRSASSKELRESARRLPEFLTMQEDGMLKAMDGLTTPTEIMANAPRDTSPRPLSKLQNIARVGRTR